MVKVILMVVVVVVVVWMCIMVKLSNGKTEPALVLVLDSYSEDEIISVCDNRASSSPVYTITDYLHLITIALRKIYVILT